MVHDVFVRALEGVARWKEIRGALAGWLSTLAVFTARGEIRRGAAGRWIRFIAPEALPEAPAHMAPRRARPRAGDVARRRTGGVRAALHRRDGADRGRGGVRLFARDNQAAPRARRDLLLGGGARSAGAGRATGPRRRWKGETP